MTPGITIIWVILQEQVSPFTAYPPHFRVNLVCHLPSFTVYTIKNTIRYQISHFLFLLVTISLPSPNYIWDLL